MVLKPSLRRLLGALTGTVLAVVLAAGLGARAAGPEAARTAPVAAAASYSKGLLWKIESAGTAPSYLFGTIHLSDPRVTTLAMPVQKAFDGARHFVMELVPDADAVALLAQSMIYADARTLSAVVGERLYAEAEAAFRRRGIPTEALAKYKPWAVAVILSMPTPDGVPLDLQLQEAAAAQGKAVEGLETTREQIAVFDELSPEEQRALLEATLREQHAFEQQIEAVVQAYLARDLARLQALTEAHAAADRALHATVMQRLLVSRNRRMVERMQPRLKQGNAFVAVGAAHLAGPEGLLALLAQRGYRVQAVY